MNVTHFLGMVLTMAATSGIGWYLSNRLGFRIADLTECKKALTVFKSEIEFSATPLCEAMENVAERTGAPVSGLFASFAHALAHNTRKDTTYRLWAANLEAQRRTLCLAEEDRNELAGFGKTLGYSDKQMQLDAIAHAVKYVETTTEKLAETTSKNQRMYRSLGVLFGVLLVVVFW